MQNLIRGMTITLAGVWTCTAVAADKPVVGPVPDWVQPSGPDLPASATTDAALLVLLSEQQVNLSPTAVETYVDNRIRIQTPQGLQAIGTIALSWQPDADVVTVHRLIVRRGAEARDVLGNGEGFTVLRREDRLEQATLTGTLTAVLQPTDLQVGDIVEFAYTHRHVDPVVPDRPDLQFAWFNTPIRTVNFRATWPAGMAVRWQLRDFKPTVQESSTSGLRSIAFRLEDPAPLLQPSGAPPRYAALRRVALTAFQSWSEVSRRLAPLYAEASRLGKDSPLRAEIERIRASHADPMARAGAALRLAQEQVRYVLLAMNQGALVPATADQTWQRRYGDCKAKTALLLALLRELDIDAEAVAVNTAMGDGVDRLLPGVSAFDHVLVRARIGGKAYWLDGTRLGDRSLERLEIPDFGWVLPLAARGSELVHIQPAPLAEPQLLQEVSLDVSANAAAPGKFQARTVFRGDGALAVKLSQDNLDATQRDQSMRSYWRSTFDELQVARVAASFDEANSTLTWTVEGTMRLDWDDDWYEVDDMRLGFKPDFTRPEGTDAEAPYSVAYPQYSVTRVTVKLPPGTPAFTTSGTDINQTLAGWEYRRTARIDKAVFTAEASSRSIVPEISAKDARASEAALRELNKNGLHIRRPQQHQLSFQPGARSPLLSARDRINRGVDMMNRMEYESASAEFTGAITLEPGNALAWANRAGSFVNMKRFAEARADLLKARELDPTEAFVLSTLGILERAENHFPEAIDLLTQALKLEEVPGARLERYYAYLGSGDYEHALQDMEVLSRADPGNATYYRRRADMLMRLDRVADARAVATAALDAKAGPADGVITAAAIYSRAGAEDQARAILTSALDRAPTAELYAARALNTKDDGVAIKDLQQALQLDPRHLRSLELLTYRQLSAKNYPAALLAADQLAAAAPPTVDSAVTRGEILVRLPDLPGARAAFLSARERSKTSSDFNSLCWSQAINNFALEDALADCQASLKLQPGCGACQDSLGFVLLRLGRYADAVAAYDVSLGQNPRRAASLFGRGLAKLRLGRNDEGEADLAAARRASADVERQFADYGMAR